MKRILFFKWICACCVISILLNLPGCNPKKDFDYRQEIYLNYQSLNANCGDQLQISASPSEKTFEWSSENPQVATVTPAGLVEAVGIGNTNIVVASEGIRKLIPVTVTVPSLNDITAKTGNKRVLFQVKSKSGKVKTLRITSLDDNKSIDVDINLQTGSFSAYFEGLEEGKRRFRYSIFDGFGNESAPVEITVDVLGDKYLESLLKNLPKVSTLFGNGLAVNWEKKDVLSISYEYVNTSDVLTSAVIESGFAPLYLLDYRKDFKYTATIFPAGGIDVFPGTDKIDLTITNNKRATLTIGAPATIFARDYDLGGEGVAYHDDEEENKGGNPGYREGLGDYNGRGVDVEGGLNIGYTNAGEWMNYTVYVADAGKYVFDLQAAVNNSAGGKYRLVVDGTPTADHDLKNANNWTCIWQYATNKDYTPPVLELSAGFHTIRWHFVNGNTNLLAFKFTYQGGL